MFSPGAGSTNVGGLVGYNDTGSSILGGLVTAKEAVTGGVSDVGGYVGYNAGFVSGVTAANNITLGNGVTVVGGVVGFDAAVRTLTALAATNTITVGNNASAVGGLIGYITAAPPGS